MSSILKALEKVEESQNSKRPGGASGLARRRERRPVWLIPAWAAGGAAVASFITFAVMGGLSPSPAKTAPSVAKAVNPPAVVAPPAAVSTAPAAAPAAKSAPVSQKVETPLLRGESVPAPKPAAKADGVPAIPVAKAATPRPVAVPVATAVATPVPALQSQEVVPGEERREIRVTGIAWQGDSESSFAMVNGRPVRQGGTVDGLKVERILEDSVRFNGSNGSITIPLGAGE